MPKISISECGIWVIVLCLLQCEFAGYGIAWATLVETELGLVVLHS